MVLAPKGAGLYCSFEGWIRVMKTLSFKFKDKVKYHSVIYLQDLKNIVSNILLKNLTYIILGLKMLLS